MAIKKLLGVFAASEAFTGVVLVIEPPLLVRLLFGADISGAGIIMSRIAGISLIALGVGCWPEGPAGRSSNGGLRAMLTYSLVATLYLTFLGTAGEWIGIFLWPAIVVHAGVTICLAREWFKV